MIQKGKLAINGGPKTVPDKLLIETWPPLGREEEEAVLRVLRSDTLSGFDAPETTALQEEWAKYVGVKYCLATNSGTAALHMAVAAAGVGPGDEVITTCLSWTSTATCILHHNGIPIFIDIEPETYCIDVAAIEDKITEKTKAIIPVHLYGQPADMDEIMDIANRHNLIVIEDACQAHGAEYRNRMTGSIGHMAAFSTQNSKHVVSGEGGLFVTNDERMYQEAARVQQFGENRLTDGKRDYDAYGMGWMYRTQEIPSAIARTQLKKLPEYVEHIRKNTSYLTEHLSKIKGIKPPVTKGDRTHVFWDYKIRFIPSERGIDMSADEFAKKVVPALKAEGIFTTRWEFVIPTMPLFQQKKGYGKGCPWKCSFAREGIEYKASDYPQAMAATGSMIGYWGIKPPNGLELMKYYVEATHKVFDNLDQIL